MVLEHGQYALLETVAKDIKNALEEQFPIDRASQIFAYASILYANNFVHMHQIQGYYKQIWLVQEYKAFSFKTGMTALGRLLDDLGRQTKRAADYGKNTILHSLSIISIDEHTICSCLNENDLGEAEYNTIFLRKTKQIFLQDMTSTRDCPCL